MSSRCLAVRLRGGRLLLACIRAAGFEASPCRSSLASFYFKPGLSHAQRALLFLQDYKFVDELVSDLGFQPSDLVERVRYLANIPSEAPMQHRLSYCIQRYADRIATDAKLRDRVASEVEERSCAQLGLCRDRGQQQIDQSSIYAELLRVLAGEMRGEKSADSSKVFQEHEQFVEFGRHLARLSGIEETFRQASYVSAQVSGRHIRESCPSLWNSWLVQVGGLMGICLLGGVFALVYKRKTVKTAPT
jgi:hypothetical protein